MFTRKALKWIAASLVIATFALVGCEDEDANKVALAQDCLDKVTAAADAWACISHVEGLETQQANILKCSIRLVAGGLTTDRVLKAYGKLGDATNAEAAFMGILAVTLPEPGSSDVVQTAQNAQSACVKSGVSGLIYIAGLSVMATSVWNVAGGFDPTNPDTLNPNDVATALGTCASGGCNDEVVGSAIITAADSYCRGDNADSSVCSDINQAITNAGGDPATVANYLYSQMAMP